MKYLIEFDTENIINSIKSIRQALGCGLIEAKSIHNLVSKARKDLISECKSKFILTGSRYFETATKNSDYDFFTEDTPENLDWLVKNDFHPIPFNAGYAERDKYVVNIWRYTGEMGLQIDVQLYPAQVVYAKESVQQIFRELGIHNTLKKVSKVEKQAMWSAAIRARLT